MYSWAVRGVSRRLTARGSGSALVAGVHDGLDPGAQQSRPPHWAPQFIGSLEKNWPAMRYGRRVRADL